MNKTFATFIRSLTLLMVSLALSGCIITLGDHSYFSTSSEPGKQSFYVKLKGDLEFNDSETQITHFPVNSTITLKTNYDGVKKKLTVKRGKTETVTYDFRINGKKAPYDQEAQQWFAKAAPSLIRETGINLAKRISRIQEQKGNTSVIEEIALIKSDYVQRRYLNDFFSNYRLSNEEVGQAIDTFSNLQSDYDMKLVAQTLAESQSLTTQNWQKAINQSIHIQSDYEMATLFKVFVAQPMNEETLSLLIQVAGQHIQSDYELASMFEALAKKQTLTTSSWHSLLDQSPQIQSDYDMSRLLKSFLEQSIDRQTLAKLIDTAANHIQSDYELSNLLTAVLRQQPVSPNVRDQILAVSSREIGSSYEREQVQRVLLAI